MIFNIQILWPWELPSNIEGKTAVVVDILAASSNLANLLSKKVADIIIVDKQNVMLYQKRFKDALIVGESMDPSLKNIFDCNNSAYNVDKLKAKGRRILYMSNNGSRVLGEILSKNPDQLLAGSFNVVSSLKEFIIKKQIESLVIVPAGEINLPERLPDKRAKEDIICSLILKGIIDGKESNFAQQIDEAKRFVRKFYGVFTNTLEEEIDIVFDRDRFRVLPFCYQDADGTIRIKDILKT